MFIKYPFSSTVTHVSLLIRNTSSDITMCKNVNIYEWENMRVSDAVEG